MSALFAADASSLAQHRRVTVAAWLWLVSGATAVSAAIELGVLRVFTRTIIHIPGANDVSPVLSSIAEAGRLAYYVTCVLLIGLFALLVVRSTFAMPRSLVVPLAIVVFGITAGGARAGGVGDGTVAVGVLVAVVALGMRAAMSVRPSRARLPVLAFSAAFAMVALDALVGGAIVTIGGGGTLRTAGEAFAVAAAIASPLALGARPGRRSIVVGVGVGVVAVALLAANSSTTTILMLWNFGFAGTFPWFLYGAAAGALACTFIELFRSGDRVGAASIALLVAGGIGLHSTYQSGLVIAGLALLAMKAEAGAIEDQVREPRGTSAGVSTRRTSMSAIASSASGATSTG